MKRLLLAAAVCLLTMSSAISTSAWAQTVILVRHAEKADDSRDALLSAEGQERAQALAATLAGGLPDHIFTSPMQRTILTAAPTAEAAGVTPQAIGFERGLPAHVEEVAAAVRALPQDSVVLIVDHSNVVPLIARALGYAEAADVPECEFDRLTRLQMQGGSVMAVVMRYGARSGC